MWAKVTSESAETCFCLTVSILLTLYAGAGLIKARSDEAATLTHRVEHCAFVARHLYGVAGKWDDESGACTIRLRFSNNDRPHETFYETDFPINQIPPSI